MKSDGGGSGGVRMMEMRMMWVRLVEMRVAAGENNGGESDGGAVSYTHLTLPTMAVV